MTISVGTFATILSKSNNVTNDPMNDRQRHQPKTVA